MQKFLRYSIVIDLWSLLSFVLFLITGDKLTLPLGLIFFLSIFSEITFIGAGFGLAIVVFVISLFVKKEKWLLIFKGAYIVLSITTIAAIVLGNINMFKETPSLLSLIVFLFFQGLLCWKWWLLNTHRASRTSEPL